MGEIMRWRLTRAAQRLIPSAQSTLDLGSAFYEITSTTLNKIESLQQNGQPVNNAPFASYSSVLADTRALRRYLATGSPTVAPASPSPPPVIQALIPLLELDDWLAATAPVPPVASPYTTPSIANLSQQIATLLGQYLPNSSAWQALHKFLCELLYAALVLSALGVNYSLTEVLGLLTRWLLVVGLVDDLQQNPSAIQTPDDVSAALRWRTLLLPDAIVLLLLGIRLSKEAVLVRKPGFADLYITREEWDHYEPAEIASIENILGRELKSRVHILVNQMQVTTTTDTTTTTVKEQDTTTTDLTQLQQQSSSDISLAAHIDGQVDTSGQYGPTQVNTHLGGSLDYSSASATSKSTTQSHETVSRAVTKIEQSTRQVRTVSTLTREKDREEHKFDNTQQQNPVVGIYRWVDQIQNVELDRYPHRFLMEFEIPEPGAWTRWLHIKDAANSMINALPLPLTSDGNPVTATNPLLQPKDVSGDPTSPNYFGKFAARYMASGISAPPGPTTIAENIGYPSSADVAESQVPWRYQSDTTLSVPNGYRAVSWVANFQYSNMAAKNFAQGLLDIAVGGGAVQESNPPPVEADHITGQFGSPTAIPIGPISVGAIPIAIQARNVNGFQINVEVTCTPLDQTVAQWQSDSYDAIVGAYSAMLQAYNDEKAGLTIQQTNLVDANSPDQNATTIQQEMKRQVIEMLIGKPFSGRNAISWGNSGTGTTQPMTILNTAARVAPEVQFLEEAFEWETLSYICYPYYWADSSRWPDLTRIEGDDSDFADFLRAGSARVVLAARPGFEDQVNFYVQFGILWGGGPMPAPGDPDYLSIADEIKAMQQQPLGVTVIDTWQVVLPTTLIWLENPDGLPTNQNKTITYPFVAPTAQTPAAVMQKLPVAGVSRLLSRARKNTKKARRGKGKLHRP